MTRGGADLATRVEALAQAAQAGEGRLPVDVLQGVNATVARVRERLALAPGRTVVALAGATGSGKSSVANALTGTDVAQVGVRRPTTAEPVAAVWPADDGAHGDAHGLLDWLAVHRRVEVDTGGLPGLVLLDLPDHDSVEVTHRAVAERLYTRADLLVWVLDPQKYADAALHVRYLRPLAGHAGVMVLVLNHADRLEAGDLEACVADLRRLAAQDGLGAVPVLAVSARTGWGVPQLRDLLGEAAARRRAAVDRLEADVVASARRVQAEVPAAPRAARAGRGSAPSGQVDALVTACEQAAGVPVVVRAVQAAAARHGRAATGWPPLRWVHRWRADPLRRLHLRVGTPLDATTTRTGAGTMSDGAREGVTGVSGGAVARARVSDALRTYLAAELDGAPPAWVEAARAAASTEDLPDALDQAVVGTTLLPERSPLWWRAVGVAQGVLLAAAGAGVLWLAALAVLAYLRLPEPTTPQWGGVPAPTALALGGVLAGVLLAVLGAVLSGWGARRRAAIARRRLRAAVADVVRARIVVPVTAEVDRWVLCRTSADRAAGAARRTHDPEGAR
ncbi:GTPase family protein [Cellulomonas soli]|uniref:GTPase family protein n=1 Tax=Cellulomonas soli TaxID=931535 RepID=UPI003F85430D